MNRHVKRVLLVEGRDDLRVVPYLVEAAGIPWGSKEKPIVKIIDYGGIDELLTPGEIETHLKASDLASLGVLVDADESVQSRWEAIRTRIAAKYPDAPVSMDPDGLVLTHEDSTKFGTWIMPDNINRGMLESFLLFLRPTDNQQLLSFAENIVAQAKGLGAPFRDNHADKAQVHCWLSWQDPPGRQLHNAIMERMLTHKPDCFTKFIAWFCRLYGLEEPTSTVK